MWIVIEEQYTLGINQWWLILLQFLLHAFQLLWVHGNSNGWYQLIVRRLTSLPDIDHINAWLSCGVRPWWQPASGTLGSVTNDTPFATSEHSIKYMICGGAKNCTRSLQSFVVACRLPKVCGLLTCPTCMPSSYGAGGIWPFNQQPESIQHRCEVSYSITAFRAPSSSICVQPLRGSWQSDRSPDLYSGANFCRCVHSQQFP